MIILPAMVLGLSVGPLVIAAAIRFLPMRRTVRLGRRIAIVTFIAGLIPWIGTAAPMLTSLFPIPPMHTDMGARAVTPLLLGSLSVMLLMIPAHRTRFTGTATLARRRVSQFVSSRWTWAIILLVALVLALTIAAGVASKIDENGHRTMYWISGGNSTFGTQIYGWYFSTPSLIVMAILLILAAVALALIPRPAWRADAETDAAVRRVRAANVCRITSGVLLVHLSTILVSLAGTASMTGTSLTAELGEISAFTPFAALQPLLQWSGLAALLAGLTLCATAAFTAIPLRVRQP